MYVYIYIYIYAHPDMCMCNHILHMYEYKCIHMDPYNQYDASEYALGLGLITQV
jgi:hypothetical protein